MGFQKDALPSAEEFFSHRGLTLKGPSRSKWKTAPCEFHGSSDSLRVNTHTGAWVCMAGCGAKGGDVLSYAMASDGLDFVTAARQLGAWVDDPSKPFQRTRPTPLPARDALSVLTVESLLIAVIAADLAAGKAVSETDRTRLNQAAGRVAMIAEAYQ